MTTVLLAVGDVSGDAIAAGFAHRLRELEPDLHLVGMGGDEMEKAGIELVVHQRELAVGGFVELVPDLHRIVRTWRRLGRALETRRPDLVVLIDSAGFNLPFARRARRRGIPVLYYVCPQVWAWRRGRIRKLVQRVDRLAAILPFEAEVWAGSGVPLDVVGHPLVDRLAGIPRSRIEARRALDLPVEGRQVALLPGSRRSEWRRGLSVFLDAARTLHARLPDLRFALPAAPGSDRASLSDGIRRAGLPSTLELRVFPGRSAEVLAASDVALVKPGTGTLEAALLDCPMVVAARVSPISAALVRRLVCVESLALPNLLAGRRVVPEFYQGDARPERLADELAGLLSGPAREAQRTAFRDVARSLGGGGASQRAAQIAQEMLGAGQV